MCEVTPVHALRGVDLYRKDGLSTSILFKLWPIALKDTEIKSEDMNMPNGVSRTNAFHPLMYKKRYKELKLRERSKTLDNFDDYFTEDSTSDLKHNKEEGLSKSQPSMLVSVDTSGARFERMASFRRSTTETELVHSVDRKKRRRTVMGITDNIIQEIEHFEKGRRILRQEPRKYSLDNLDTNDIDAKDELMQEFLKEIDNQRAEREELANAEKDKKLLKFIPCRRSRSLPRCVKLLSETFGRKEPTRTPLYVKKSQTQRVPMDEMRLTKEETSNTTVHNFGGSNASLGSSGTGRLSRASRRSSIIGSKIKSLMSGSVKRRPKSLDFDSIGVIDGEDKKKKKQSKQVAERSVSMSRISAAAPVPEVVTRAASSESTIGPGSYYYFDCNTIPRAQQSKYNFPWDSLPKDWTTAVRLREINKRRKEDRQSSSGNWSASGYSSSNRQSLDSDAKPGIPNMPSYLASQHSIGRDSGRDSPVEEKDGLDTGYMGDAASMESVSDTKSMSNTDSDDWIKSLAERAAGRGDVTSTSADALANLSRLTKENIRNLDILVPGRSPRHRMHRMDLDEDGESSVYSLDQDGFYTSFHNDSGLRRSSNNLLEEDEDLMMPRIRECRSLQSMSSHSTDSALFRSSVSTGKLTLASSSSHESTLQNTKSNDDACPQDETDTLESENYGIEYGDNGTIKAAKNKTKKRVPPPPPPRTSSCLKESLPSNSKRAESNNIKRDNLSPTSSESSDQETIYARLKTKTRISAQAIPSLCSDVMSDDDDTLSHNTLSASCERLNAETSEIEEILQGVKNGKLPGTLPRVKDCMSPKTELEEAEYPANSWPRLKKLGLKQQQGILKTPEKEKIPGQQKTLNFDPVVNLFDPHSPDGGGRQMPLSCLSSSDESPSSPPIGNISTFDSPSKRNTGGLTPGEDQGRSSQLENKENSMQWERQVVSSTPVKNSCKSLRAQFSDVDVQSDDSLDHQSLLSVDDPSQDSVNSLEPKSLGSLDKSDIFQGSTSTIALSDIDTASLTHVSMTTDSTPSGSTLSLNWDTDYTPNVTPMPTPAREHKVLKLEKSLNDLSSPPSDRESKTDINVDQQKLEIEAESHISQSPPPLPPPSSLPLCSSSLPSPPLPPPPTQSSDTLLSSSSLEFIDDYGDESSHITTSYSDKDKISINIVTNDIDSFHVPSDNKTNNNNYNNVNNNITNTRLKNNQYSYSSESSSDNNFHHSHIGDNNSSKFVYPETGPIAKMPKSNSWSADENANTLRTKKNATSSNSFQYNPSWSGSGSNKYQVRISHQSRGQIQPSGDSSDRRRSSPVAVDILNLNQENTNYDDPTQQRRSSTNLLSPADSGFGSPTISSLPNHSNYNTRSTCNHHSLSSRASLPSSSTPYHHQTQANFSSSNVPQIKQPLLNKDSSKTPHYPSSYHKPALTNKQEYRNKPLNASHSNDSLSSQSSSSSSSKHLISQKSKVDYTRPVLLRGSSNESLKSNSSAGRSDSYRAAQLSEYDDKTSLLSSKQLLPPQNKHEDKKNVGKYSMRSNSTSSSKPATLMSHNKTGPQLTKSLSTPAPSSTLHTQIPNNYLIQPPMNEIDAYNRADSYRSAMQNSENAATNNWMARNSSYRLATAEEDVVFNSRMDFYNLWTGTTGGTRDVRRMGITDVDQLKTFDGNHDTGNKFGNRPQPETVHVRKKLSVKENGPSPVNKPPGVQMRKSVKPDTKDKGKHKTQSSSYIRFDPIFESREDIRASKESLRPPSITSIRTLTQTDSSEALTAETAHLMSYKNGPKTSARRRSGSQGRRSSDEKSGILGTIKTTIKSIGGGKGDN